MDLDSKTFKEFGYAAIDYVANYIDTIRERYDTCSNASQSFAGDEAVLILFCGVGRYCLMCSQVI